MKKECTFLIVKFVIQGLDMYISNVYAYMYIKLEIHNNI